jgi:hypothetical protein
MGKNIRLLLALSLLALLLGCSKVKMANYAKIKMGLTYDQVVAILGKPDSCSEALYVRSCVWGGEERNITVNFMADKVVLYSSRNIQ